MRCRVLGNNILLTPLKLKRDTFVLFFMKGFKRICNLFKDICFQIKTQLRQNECVFRDFFIKSKKYFFNKSDKMLWFCLFFISIGVMRLWWQITFLSFSNTINTKPFNMDWHRRHKKTIFPYRWELIWLSFINKSQAKNGWSDVGLKWKMAKRNFHYDVFLLVKKRYDAFTLISRKIWLIATS